MFFSVVIPLYNKEISITNTVNSVLQQSHKDFELIIVNDGSTDNSLSVVEAICDNRIKIVNKPNGGVSSARNTGIEHAQCDWIAFLDGDDLWQPQFLEEIESMVHDFPLADIISTNYSGGHVGQGIAYDTRGYVTDYYGTVLKYGAIIWSSAVCVKKSCFAKTGGFRTYLCYGEDLEMWSRLINSYKLAYSPKVLSHYNMEAENRSQITSIIPHKHWATYIQPTDSTLPNWLEYYRFIIDRYCACAVQTKKLKNIHTVMKQYGIITFLRSNLRIVLKRINIYRYNN